MFTIYKKIWLVSEVQVVHLVEVHRLPSTSGEEEQAEPGAAPLLLPVVPEQRPGEAALQGAHTDHRRDDTL